MTYELSIQEKTEILNNHLKNIEHNKYNVEVSLLEENALDNPSQSVIQSLNEQIENFAAKKSALMAELANISE
jgi:hypothetical protein